MIRIAHNTVQHRHTIRGVSQLSAHHTGIFVVPEVITDGAPSAIDTHLHPPIPVVPSVSYQL